MNQSIRRACFFFLLIGIVIPPPTLFAAPKLIIEAPMSPPTWALLERELLRASAAACEEYFAHYFDARGYLLCVTRWGGDDGPDDAIENLATWPELHALGAPDVMLLQRSAKLKAIRRLRAHRRTRTEHPWMAK